jgi:hypothetical protein
VKIQVVGCYSLSYWEVVSGVPKDRSGLNFRVTLTVGTCLATRNTFTARDFGVLAVVLKSQFLWDVAPC